MSNTLMTTDQVAKYLQVTPRTVFRYMDEGLLHGFKAGKGWKFEEKDVQECVAKLRDLSEQRLAAKRAAKEGS